jgi:hypothetical protein
VKEVMMYDPEILGDVLHSDGKYTNWAKPGQLFKTKEEAELVYAEYIHGEIALKVNAAIPGAIQRIIQKAGQSSDPIGMCVQEIEKMLGAV